jgi:hypothetical protein
MVFDSGRVVKVASWSLSLRGATAIGALARWTLFGGCV